MPTTRYFADLAIRPHEEMSEDEARRAGSFAAVVFDDAGRAESAAMMADDEIDQVRWFAAAPSAELHARHVARYGARGYTVSRQDACTDGEGRVMTTWTVEEDGGVRIRDVLRFASAQDDTIVESWRYDRDDRLCFHYVYSGGRLVGGEEYLPDGTLHRAIGATGRPV